MIGSGRMNVFLRLGFSVLLLGCAPGSTQGPECGAGCHRQHGFCERSGECRCRSGWRGARCDQCVPSSGCAHGTCEAPGQCICDRGWTGARCDRDARRCSSQLCSGNSTCVEMDGGGHVCLMKSGPCPANSSLCQNGGSCVSSRSSCFCPVGFSGLFCEIRPVSCEPNPSCERPLRLKLRVRGRAHHLGPPALHKLLLRPDRASAPRVSRSQLICFLILGLLTALVVLLTSGLVFFSRCEAWLANCRYRRLVRNQRNQRNRGPVNIILPENTRLSHYEPLYSI